MNTSIRKFIRGTEFILLFFGIPVILYFDSFIVHPSRILLPVVAALIVYFLTKKDFALKSLVKLRVSKETIRENVWVVLASTLVLTAYVAIFKPENLFNLPRKNPQIWLMLGAFYPVFSAYLQEIIYRTFLFTRYGPLFKKRYWLVLVSGITFSFAHIIYYSPVSVLLTLIAGLYLAYVYEKTRSVLYTAILHSIFGMLVFTIGMGQHFWLDMNKYL